MKSTWPLIGAVFTVCCYVLGVSVLFEKLQARFETLEAKFTNCDMADEVPDYLPEQVAVDKKLAIVVPVHAGDTTRAYDSLSLWPTVCAQSTLRNVDLVMYYAGDLDEEGDIFHIPDAASRCFRETKMVSARLTKEEDVYPVGPSAQFFKLFLEPCVHEHFKEYDALAIIEWDVVVAHDTSFGRLYTSAFSNNEPFWMKGSILAGTEFHDTATLPGMWHVLGHLNGNAIYNYTDPAFFEFVNYTFTQWKYTYPYDVALWVTISDFPYTWTLWQRYSSKFVTSNLISNVGFYDVSDKVVRSAIAADTLFIHGSIYSGGSVWNIGATTHEAKLNLRYLGCEAACGSNHDFELPPGVSTACDETCSVDHPLYGSRFDGYNCGAGHVRTYGQGCRLCYTNVDKALAAERALATADASSPLPDLHVIMCSTMSPPESTSCSKACNDDQDTVCDGRCGTGHYGDFHCNWRGFGEACRFCFRDIVAAKLADQMATASGGRVIMCDTHEPPRNTDQPATDVIVGNVAPIAVATLETHDMHRADEDSSAEAEFPGETTRSQICALIPGHFEFLAETNVTVSSILHFMPGMRVVIATNPVDFHVYNRTLGKVPTVSVVNASHVELAALAADRTCGEETRLIYYLNPGQVLSRTFTRKDTHSPRGELLVGYAHVDRVGEANAQRSMAATWLLGYNAPSFTFGSDLILPAETTSQLRAVLRDAARALGLNHSPEMDEIMVAEADMRRIEERMKSLTERHGVNAAIHIPELLAAVSYVRNTEGVRFVDIKQWSHENLFEAASIWDIPLVKPTFGCSVDVSWSLNGYDVAAELQHRLKAFSHGARCEQGFMSIEKSALKTKAHWEFGPQDSLEALPDIRDYRISVMYRTFSGDADLFKLSLPTVIDRFPEALEVVVVVEEVDRRLFEGILRQFKESAPFPLRLVAEPSYMDGHIQQKYSKVHGLAMSSLLRLSDIFAARRLLQMRADLYTEGDYILHLDSDVVVFEKVTYDHIFHLGKPVLPFRRHRDDTHAGKSLLWCWQNGTSFAVGEDVLHEFSIFNTHVYPRSMYPALRSFIKKRHGLSFVDFMSTRRGECMSPKTLSTWTLEERTLLLSDFNVMGAYLWYHMHDAVHWMATDPLDIQPDEWRRDVTTYAWVCQANGRRYPDDEAGRELFKENYLAVRNPEHCRILTEAWLHPKMLLPQTRTIIDTTTWR